MDWTGIRNLGKVKYFNISYVVMFAVPILAEAYRAWSFGAFIFRIEWKILYASSLTYAVAIAIYQFFCPATVKMYESAESYALALFELYERAYPERKLEIARANLPETEGETRAALQLLSQRLYGNDVSDGARARSELETRLAKLYPSVVQQFLVRRYTRDQKSRPFARWAAAVCYAAGTAGLLYLLVTKSVNVFRS